MTALDVRVAAAVAAWPDHRTPAEQAELDALNLRYARGALQWVRTGVKPATTKAAQR